jgi:hypothetical protein
MTPATCCPIVELRQYTLHPGTRDTLIELFDREFVESQEAVGMTVIGQFRDLDDPNRFVWLRGFADMRSRTKALTDFYGGPVWKKHRDAANATMVDWSNVLLLRPARPGSGFSVGQRLRKGLLICTTYSLREPADAELIELFEDAVTSRGVRTLASFVTESSPNDYAALPVREGEHVLVGFSESAVAATDLLARRLLRRPEVLRLEPTPRSRLGA